MSNDRKLAKVVWVHGKSIAQKDSGQGEDNDGSSETVAEQQTGMSAFNGALKCSQNLSYLLRSETA